MLGYSRQELAVLTWDKLTHPDDMEPSFTQFQKVLDGELEGYSLDKRFIRKDGEILYVILSFRGIRYESGAFRYGLVLFQDITERKMVEEERQRLAAALDQAAEHVVITDAEARILYVNPAFEEGTGYSREEAVGHLVGDLIRSDEQGQSFLQELWHSIQSGEVWKGQIRNRRKDGTEYDSDVTISPVRDSQGEISTFVSVQRDVTREHQLERQLVQAQKLEAIGTLAGGIAHDFNNILSAVLGYASLAMDEVDPDSTIWEYLDQVTKAGQRASDLVKQVLMFSRQTDQEHRTVMLQPLLKEVLKLLRGTLPTTIDIQHEIDDSCGQVLANPTQLHQVLLNLGTNAYHAMKGRPGVFSIALEERAVPEQESEANPDLSPGRYACIEVSDTGHGMDAATLERIFEPYFTTKAPGEGTGLGLSTVHGIVRGHRGVLRVQSAVGKGTTFEILLPISQTGQVEADGQSVEEHDVRGTERLLVVDDEETLLAVMQKTLSRLGYDVTVCTSSVQALEILRNTPKGFDMLVTDQTMPMMTGIELAKEVASLRPEFPVILCSGLSMTLNEAAARRHGIRRFLMKPLAAKRLAAHIREVFEEVSATPT